MPSSQSLLRPALIFDFGNVIAFFDYGRACERVARTLGLTGKALLARARGAGLVPLVERYEQGQLDDRAFAGAFCRMTGVDLSFEEFAAAWADIFWLNEPVARLIEELDAQGYTLALGSNTNAIHARHFCRVFADTLDRFDHWVFSYEIGHAKPAAVFFQACTAALGAPPGDCVFIDDLPANVAGARAAGLEAIRFRDVPDLLVALHRLGIEVPPYPNQPAPRVDPNRQ